MTPLCLSYSEARQNLSQTIKTCVDDSTPVIIRSRQREVVMIPREEWESWMETMHQLDAPANVRHLERSLEERNRGESVVMSADDLKKFMSSTEDEA
ncbi:type II toxin-antitoxin system Phd/YefM family antitoxin [Akkermansia glycaniphila]|uniref:Antitoxin n=1 Tax=Akkermansia glycaniphila TaxID=1679444 RepID=A0A1C7PAI1_9BACT|nr:type II toxin-antitoxin system prevent-host-death family antitoxin [Akkermansia glycaniphila]OCA02586.1 hypothetical protein AC781_09640 [Akkermansia glycaniphila]SEH97755.1 antitoxin phd yefm type ii toxin-antitoxin system [Akkermansia glycaniphila]